MNKQLGKGRTRRGANISHRREQLRLAKRAQRDRDREAGLVLCQIKLRPSTAKSLRRAIAIAGFEGTLARVLDESLVDVQAYPNLHLVCWNRAERYIPAADAFALYERNWRFIDEKSLQPAERKLIERLTRTHGAGLLNV